MVRLAVILLNFTDRWEASENSLQYPAFRLAVFSMAETQLIKMILTEGSRQAISKKKR